MIFRAPSSNFLAFRPSFFLANRANFFQESFWHLKLMSRKVVPVILDPQSIPKALLSVPDAKHPGSRSPNLGFLIKLLVSIPKLQHCFIVIAVILFNPPHTGTRINLIINLITKVQMFGNHGRWSSGLIIIMIMIAFDDQSLIVLDSSSSYWCR